MKFFCLSALFSFLLLSPLAYATSGPSMGKTVCALEEGDLSIKVVHESCEFPEGNKTQCLQVVSVEKGKSPRYGGAVFRKGQNFNNFCLTDNKFELKEGLKARIISSSRRDDVKAFLECPSAKNKARIHLRVGKLEKLCEASF